MQMSDCNAPVRARLVTEPYRRILKTPGYAGGYLLSSVSYSIGYRLTVVAGAVRYDKDGQPCGTVTPEEEADSVQRMEKIKKQQAKGKAE